MRRISTDGGNPDSKAAKKRQAKVDRKAAAKLGYTPANNASYYPPIPNYFNQPYAQPYQQPIISSVDNVSSTDISVEMDIDDIGYTQPDPVPQKTSTSYKIPARVQERLEFAWIVESAGVTQLVSSASQLCRPEQYLVEYLVWSAEDFIQAVANSIIPAPTVSTVTYKYTQDKKVHPEYYTCNIGKHKVHIDKIARIETQRIDEEITELEEELRELRNLRTLIDYSHCVE